MCFDRWCKDHVKWTPEKSPVCYLLTNSSFPCILTQVLYSHGDQQVPFISKKMPLKITVTVAGVELSWVFRTDLPVQQRNHDRADLSGYHSATTCSYVQWC
ncbi:hypothetical protein AVEN_154932-1 [Araneus ventricosus]|uniref:Uncharacterized protein n=1 Tax=Araneus ventricosus TaxID=182803 RepID=A0A4Y2A758_ARAVE|nr:hypothetical protein AVEN_154932-1 [Araneus ventricosus]